ncbi:MAG: hypothetical protein RRB24_03245 [Armatimonadota bacterium]|jgi:hypothetical protein|nr:hypothetical protein [Armatimonadota bacterium]MDT7971822.1 hypothetical protein [Armatimonadota bacterium]
MSPRGSLNPYGFFGEIVRKAQWVTGEELDEAKFQGAWVLLDKRTYSPEPGEED